MEIKAIGRPRNHLALLGLAFFTLCFQFTSTDSHAQSRTSDRLLSRLSAKSTTNLKVSFNYSPKFPTEGQPVQFVASYSGSPLSLRWDFGDGTSSTESNPTHIYTESGFRKVSLVAGTDNSTKTASRTLTILPATANATFVFSPLTPGPGQTVQFADTTTGSPSSWKWSFGDGASSSVKNPNHAYGRAGEFTVTLVASGSSGSKQGSRTITVTAVSVLTVSFTYAPSYPTAGQSVQFTDTSSGSPSSWLWNFGDGTTSTLQNPSHTYTTAGSKTVTLTATNGSGSNVTTRTVTIGTALSASFSYSPASPTAGQSVQFTDTSSGSPTSWLWNFGDGTTSTLQNPKHTYATAGSKTVTLTATNGSGSNVATRTVTIGTALSASFSFSPASPTAGQSVQFTDTSSGSPTSWLWIFGDGTTSTLQNPKHTYAAEASYTATLTIGNGSGSTSVSQTIRVLASSVLAASFTYSPVSPVVGQAVQFTDTSTGLPTSWIWDFGDGTSSTAQNPSHTYSAATSCVAVLTAKAGSNQSTASKTITIGFSKVITAASPSLADVRAAINSADPGDTVLVPPGSATWSGSAVFGQGLLAITKPIRLIGAGIGVTIITSGYSAAGGGDTKDPRNYLISYIPTRANALLDLPFQISGFTFDLDKRCSGIELLGPGAFYSELDIPTTKNRIDHNRFIDASGGFDGWNIFSKGPFYGCIDNNIFSSGGINFNGTNNVQWGSSDPRVSTFDFGSPYNMYVEDNSFTVVSGGETLLIYGCDGGRYCFRYNTITTPGGAALKPLCDMHGNQDGSGENGVFGAEIYENTITAKEGYIADHRGGKLLCYNNHATVANQSWSIHVTEEHNDYAGPSPFVSATSQQHQFVTDSYYWGNSRTYQGSTGPISTADVISTFNYTSYGIGYGVTPTPDINFWSEPTLSESFTYNGSRGMGFGPLSNRPSSPTLEGTAWWDTVNRRLYRWRRGAWELYYTPYTYPHPLRGSATLGD